MEITVTTEAKKRLEEIATNPARPIRINGELVGGCGMTVEYALWWDDMLPHDLVIPVGGLTLVIDQETRDYIGADKLVIDYRPQQGFRLITPQQIVAYGIKVKERWS